MPLYEELVQKYKVHYIAGGAAQNSIRGAQVHTPFPAITLPNIYTYVSSSLISSIVRLNPNSLVTALAPSSILFLPILDMRSNFSMSSRLTQQST